LPVVAPERALEQRATLRPDAMACEDAVEPLPARRGEIQNRQQGELPSKRPGYQNRFYALRAEPVEHADRTRRVAREHRVGQPEHVEAGAVRDGLEHFGLVDGAAPREERKFQELLIRRKQMTLDAVGEELRGGRRQLHAVARRALANPLRELRALDRTDLDDDAGVVERLDPLRARRGGIEPCGDRDDQKPIGIRPRRKLAEHACAGIARARRRQSELEDPARREQRQVVCTGQQLVPVEAPVRHVELARLEAVAARRSADRGERIRDEERLIAGHEIDRRKPALEMTRERAKLDLQIGITGAGTRYSESCDSSMPSSSRSTGMPSRTG